LEENPTKTGEMSNSLKILGGGMPPPHPPPGVAGPVLGNYENQEKSGSEFNKNWIKIIKIM